MGHCAECGQMQQAGQGGSGQKGSGRNVATKKAEGGETVPECGHTLAGVAELPCWNLATTRQASQEGSGGQLPKSCLMKQAREAQAGNCTEMLGQGG